MAADLEIRRYQETDADRVWDVHEDALRASPIEFLEDAPADEDLTDISAEYLEAGGEFLVGVANDVIVAIGGFQPRGDGVVELRRMRVHPDQQRKGYGERMLGALEARATARGFDRIVLDTNEQLSAAQQLYEACGYDELRRESHPVTGDEFIYYEKDLGSES